MTPGLWRVDCARSILARLCALTSRASAVGSLRPMTETVAAEIAQGSSPRDVLMALRDSTVGLAGIAGVILATPALVALKVIAENALDGHSMLQFLGPNKETPVPPQAIRPVTELAVERAVEPAAQGVKPQAMR